MFFFFAFELNKNFQKVFFLKMLSISIKIKIYIQICRRYALDEFCVFVYFFVEANEFGRLINVSVGII